MKPIKIGLIGLGTVGGGVVEILKAHHDDIVRHAGVDLQLVRAADTNEARFAQLGLGPDVATTDGFAVIADPEVDVVVELVGGTGIAHKMVIEALKAGKSVVTANKALLATHGEEIFALADARGLDIRFEAAVGGGIPILGPLTHSTTANEFSRVLGIVNGTTNYMLTRMTEAGLDFDTALKEAQDLGYAEADPTADVDGYDAAAKIAILASMVFNSRVTLNDVPTQGIRELAPADIAYAAEIGYTVKLLALANKTDSGIDIRVHPTMIPAKHQLASVDGVYNAIYLTGDFVGDLMFFGEGAGAGAAASAVVGDIVEAARTLGGGTDAIGCTCTDNLPIRALDDLVCRYYFRLIVADRAGVIAAVARVLADHRVSMQSLIQRGTTADGMAEVVYVTHAAREGDIQAALAEIRELDVVSSVASLIRVEDLA
ncbi:MAG: homoserine dehydrogenase [Actinomycetes bacterium]|jgi:homoserine dehydrogenase|nr:homoserine dehydrogenase [Actinomycetes bacterium]